MTFILRLVITGVALAAAVWIVPGLSISTSSSLTSATTAGVATVVAYAVLAVIFGLVNAIIKPVVSFLSTPVTCLTLGLFALVINAAMLWVTSLVSQFTPFALQLGSFWWTVVAAMIIALVSAVLGAFLPEQSSAQRD